MLVCAFFISNLSSSELQKYNTQLHHKPDIYSYCIQGNIRIRVFFPFRPPCLKANLRLFQWLKLPLCKLTQLRLDEFKTWRNRFQYWRRAKITRSKKNCIQYFGLCLCIYRARSFLNVQNCMHHAMFLMRLLSIHLTANDEKESYKFQKYRKKYYNLFNYFSVCKSGVNGNNSI